LLVFVDDATSRLMHLSFVASESAFAYFQATRAYLEDHGKPIALYSDKHSVFRTNKPEAAEGGMTQFGRALHELNIDILCANAPEAKGRVERAHKTLQDRLVKELRLAGANDIDAGNALLPPFMVDYNRRFAKPARNDKDLHRPLAPQDDLDGSFAWRVERTVTNSLTVQYDRVMFILEPNEITRALPAKRSPSTTSPMAGSRSATRAWPCPTAPSTGSRGSIRVPSSRTSGLARRWRCVGRCRRSCRLRSGAGRRRRERRSQSTCSRFT
jgi:hypothetical protein